MATKAKVQTEVFEKEALFIGRFVHDVLVYTLTKCGLPETSLPTTDCEENVYSNSDFVKVAGVSVLRVSLVVRDNCKQMFISRFSESGFTSIYALDFLNDLLRFILCCPGNRESTKEVVEQILAVGNEIMVYFYFENIDIDFKIVVTSISVFIIGIIGVHGNDCGKLEELFDNFVDISGYTEWITDFMTKFAFPYRFRDNVSDLFIEHVREQYKVNLRKLKDGLRFLPQDIFSDITDQGPENLAKPIMRTSVREMLELLKLPSGSEIGAVEGKKFISCRSTCTKNVSEQFSKSKQTSRRSSEVELEKDLGQMSLVAKEDSQEMHGAKSKTAPNEKDICNKES